MESSLENLLNFFKLFKLLKNGCALFLALTGVWSKTAVGCNLKADSGSEWPEGASEEGLFGGLGGGGWGGVCGVGGV